MLKFKRKFRRLEVKGLTVVWVDISTHREDEDVGSRFLQKIDIYLAHYTASHPVIQQSSQSHTFVRCSAEKSLCMTVNMYAK